MPAWQRAGPLPFLTQDPLKGTDPSAQLFLGVATIRLRRIGEAGLGSVRVVLVSVEQFTADVLKPLPNRLLILRHETACAPERFKGLAGVGETIFQAL